MSAENFTPEKVDEAIEKQRLQFIQDSDMYLNGNVPFGMVLIYLAAGEFRARREGWPAGDELFLVKHKPAATINQLCLKKPGKNYELLWHPLNDDLFSADWEILATDPESIQPITAEDLQ